MKKNVNMFIVIYNTIKLLDSIVDLFFSFIHFLYNKIEDFQYYVGT